MAEEEPGGIRKRLEQVLPISIGKVKFEKQALEALGMTLEEALDDFATNMASLFGDRMKEEFEIAVGGITEAFKKSVEDLKDHTTKAEEDIITTTERAYKMREQLSEQDRANLREWYQKLETSAQEMQQRYDKQLERLQRDTEYRLSVLQGANIRTQTDPVSGKPTFMIGGEWKEMQDITPEELMRYVSLSQREPERQRRMPELERPFMGVVGGISPITEQLGQMIGTVAPTGYEQAQMGLGMAGAATQGVQQLGAGLMGMGGALGAAGSVLGPVGIVAGGVLSVAMPIIQGIMQRNREREEMLWGFGRGAGNIGYGLEARAVYEEFAGKFDPALKKEQVKELVAALGDLGESAENLAKDVEMGAYAMMNFGISAQEYANMAITARERVGLTGEEVYTGLAGQIGTLRGTGWSAPETTQLLGGTTGMMYQYGMVGGLGPQAGGERFKEVQSTLVQAFAQVGVKGGVTSPDMINTIMGNILQTGYWDMFYDKDPSQCSPQELVTRIFNFLYSMTNPQFLIRDDAVGQAERMAMVGYFGGDVEFWRDIGYWMMGRTPGEIGAEAAGKGKFAEERMGIQMDFARNLTYEGVMKEPRLREHAAAMTRAEFEGLDEQGRRNVESTMKLGLMQTGIPGFIGEELMKTAMEREDLKGLPISEAIYKQLQEYSPEAAKMFGGMFFPEGEPGAEEGGPGTQVTAEGVTIQLKEGATRDLFELVTNEKLMQELEGGEGYPGSNIK